jgi:hypothetical protein
MVMRTTQEHAVRTLTGVAKAMIIWLTFGLIIIMHHYHQLGYNWMVWGIFMPVGCMLINCLLLSFLVEVTKLLNFPYNYIGVKIYKEVPNMFLLSPVIQIVIVSGIGISKLIVPAGTMFVIITSKLVMWI